MKHNRFYRYRVVSAPSPYPAGRWLVVDTADSESAVDDPFTTRAAARVACDKYNLSGPASVDALHQRNKNAPPQSDAKKAQAGR